MHKISSNVATIAKIGPKYKDLLAKLGIYSIEDLLYHRPIRYEDYSKITNIAELEPDKNVTIKAKINKIDNIYTKTGKRLTKAVVGDSSGKVEVVWFNQQYIAKSIKLENEYYFSGKVQVFNNKISMPSPQFEEIDKQGVSTARIVPIYPETAGLTSKWLRSRINDILPKLLEEGAIGEYLPEKLLSEYNLLDLPTALCHLHMPEGTQDISQAEKSLAFRELVIELLKVQKTKDTWKSAFSAYRLDYKKLDVSNFTKNLGFSLTNSQEKAIEEILNDTDRERPMNRLLEGDVGSGKTIVAVAAAYNTLLNGHSTIYMAPTGILAQQHYSTFKKFLEPLGIKVLLITGSEKQPIEESTPSIIIGTHALLHLKKGVKNLGLVIIDEQHRFGVEQRSKVMGTNEIKPHLLSMTATPIPRTLALTIYGHLEISTLDTVPNTEKKITTKVISESQRNKVFEWIRKRNEPTFIVCPFIESSTNEDFENIRAAETEFQRLQQGSLKGKAVGLLHGRMSEKEKNQTLDNFRTGKIKFLISTPVIEVGVDIPEATIIVIESAERYGLASLHQLRGRVGRGAKEGFCFLFMSGYSKNSYTRLKNLEITSSGLKLAEIDMKYRGQGNIYGTQQHGFKNFKYADFSDLKAVRTAKKAAEELYGQLEDLPNLKQKLDEHASMAVSN